MRYLVYNMIRGRIYAKKEENWSLIDFNYAKYKTHSLHYFWQQQINGGLFNCLYLVYLFILSIAFPPCEANLPVSLNYIKARSRNWKHDVTKLGKHSGTMKKPE